eukprot:gene12820-27033_t
MDKALLSRATVSSDTPTPGYMLSEISRATIASFQHVARNGRIDFKKEMTKSLDPIKECLQYTGRPDPLRGDEIYKRVRDAAKEALEAIFESQPSPSSASLL